MHPALPLPPTRPLKPLPLPLKLLRQRLRKRLLPRNRLRPLKPLAPNLPLPAMPHHRLKVMLALQQKQCRMKWKHPLLSNS